MINRLTTKKLISRWKTVYNIPRHCLLIPVLLSSLFRTTIHRGICTFSTKDGGEVINEQTGVLIMADRRVVRHAIRR